MKTYGTPADLFHWKCWNKVLLGTHSIEKVKIKYGWEFNPLEKPKQGTAGDLFYWKGQNKVRVGNFFSLKMPKKGVLFLFTSPLIYFRGCSFYWKCWNKVRLRINSIQKTKIRKWIKSVFRIANFLSGRQTIQFYLALSHSKFYSNPLRIGNKVLFN